MKVSNGANGKAKVVDDLFKIRADVPPPTPHSKYVTGKTATLRKLKRKGQSVLIPGTIASNSSLASTAIGKGKYTMRTEGANCRVWRTG